MSRRYYSKIKNNYQVWAESRWLHNRLVSLERAAFNSPQVMRTYERRSLRTIRAWQFFTLAFRIILTIPLITIPLIWLYKRVTGKSWFKIDAVKLIKKEFKPALSQPLLSSHDAIELEKKNALPEIKSNDVVIGNEIGSGSFGVVHKAFLNQDRVAVKMVENEKLDEIQHEGELLRSVVSEYVLHCHGYFVMPRGDNRVGLVLDYYPDDTLETLLLSKEILVWSQQRTMAYEIAAGLDAIHNAEIVHGDFKSSQVLGHRTGNEWHMKISDLGLSRTFTQERDLGGSPPYMAPELIFGVRMNNARYTYTTVNSDIYSMALVYWEIIARGQVFAEYRPDRCGLVWTKIVNDGERPKFSKKFDKLPDFRNLIQSCWHQSPDERMSLPEVMTELKLMEATTVVPCIK